MKIFKGLIIVSLLVIATKAVYPNQVDSLASLVTTAPEEEKAGIYNDIAKLYLSDDIVKGGYYAELALEHAKKEMNTKEIIRALKNLGFYYGEKKEYEKSLYFSMKAFRMLKGEDKKLKMKLLNRIAQAYGKSGKLDKSIKCFQDKLILAKELKDTHAIATCLNNIAIVYGWQNNYEEAIRHFNKSLEMSKKANDLKLKITCLSNIAKFYALKKDYQNAIIYIEKALEVAIKNEMPFWKAKVLLVLCEIYINKKDYDKALACGLEVETIAIQNNYVSLFSDIYYWISEIYRNKGMNDNAYSYLIKYTTITDSLFELKNSVQLEEVESKLQSEETIQKLSTENVIREESLKRQNLNLLILGLLVIIIIVILFLLRRQSNLKQQKITLEKDIALKETLRLEAENKLVEEEKIRYREAVDGKERELALTTLHITHKNQILEDISSKIETLLSEVKNKIRPELEEVRKLITESLNLDDDWNNFKMHFEKVHPDFFERLKKDFSDITTNELKHCAYIKINLTPKEIARMLSITVKGVRSTHYRLQQKMDIPENLGLYAFIQEF